MENLEKENWAIFHERGGAEKPDADWNAEGIEVLSARNGQPTVRIRSQENGRSVLLHSSMDPLREAQRLAENTEFQQGSVVLINGFGFGYLVEAVLEIVPENIPVLVVEPNCCLFYTAMQTRDLRHILRDERLHIIVSDVAADIAARFACLFDIAKHKDIINIGLPGHQSVYGEIFTKVFRAIKDVVNAKLIQWTTLIGTGKDVTSNALKNLFDYTVNPGINLLKNKFENIPAIIVSAGPSLDKNVHLLHKAKGKALIVAVGTAMKALFKYNIEPDMIISIDPIPLSYEHLRGIETEAAFILDLQAHRDVWVHPKGSVFSSGGHPIIRWFGEDIDEKGYLPSGGSVANNALVAAFRMGADPIILVGQDLGYSKEGRTHAAGTTYENDTHDKNNSFNVKSNDGGEILTDQLLYQYLNFFQKWFRNYPERKYINATEGGAFIEGTEILTLEEVIKTYCTKDVFVQAILREVEQNYKPPALEPLIALLQKRFKEANKIIEDMEKGIKRLYDLQSACEKGQGKKIAQNLNAVKKIYKKCQNDQFIIPVAESFVQQDILRVVYRTFQAEYDENDGYKSAIRDYLLYYESTSKAIEEVRNLIKETLEQFEEKSAERRNERELY